MSSVSLLMQGFLLGLAIAAPVGPIGMLCIRQTIEYGPGVGFATGLGAAVADAIFGAIAAFGVTTVLSVLSGYETLFRFFGGIFLLVIAWMTYRASPPTPAAETDKRYLGSGFLVGLLLTLTNPATILACIALFAGLGLSGTLDRADGAVVVAGVFLGSAAWWFLLTSGVALVRHRISAQRVTAINRVTALFLALFGLWAFGTALSSISIVLVYS